MTSQRPLVSVVTVVRNEAQAVRDAVESMLRQRCDSFELEFLAVDGESTDGSREILEELARRDRRLRVLSNPRKLTPFARNIGLRAAEGEYVAMLDAHVLFDPDYIEVCLREMRRHDAIACGGRVVVTPANGSTQAQLVAWTVAAPFVSSRKSMRTLKGGFVDTLPYPVFRKQAMIDVGAYDERLARNQDNDLTSRLLAAGHRLYLTPLTKSYYRPRSTLRSMIRYAARAGYWNGVTLRANRSALSGRHLVPGAFVAVLVAPTGASAAAWVARRGRRRSTWLLPSAAALLLHLVGGAVTAAQTFATTRRRAAALLPLYALAFHVAYGLGVLAGLPGPGLSEPLRSHANKGSTE